MSAPKEWFLHASLVLLILFALPSVMGAQEALKIRTEIRSFPATDLNEELHRSLGAEFAQALKKNPLLKTDSLTYEYLYTQARPLDQDYLSDLYRQGFQALVVVDVRDAGERATLTLRIYDPVDGRVILGEVKGGPLDLVLYRQIQALAQDAASTLAKNRLFLSSPHQLADQLLTIPQISLTSPDEGAEVFLNGWIWLGQIEQGCLSFPLPLTKGQVLKLQIQKPGFHTALMEVVPQSLDEVIALPALVPLYSWGALLAWDPSVPASVLGAFRFFPVSDRWYLEASGSVRSADFSWAGTTSSATQGFNTDVEISPPARNYTRWALETGLYFGEPGQPLRFFTSAGAGIYTASDTATGSGLLMGTWFILGPQAGVEFCLGQFRAGFALATELALDSDIPCMPSGTLRFFQPSRLYVEVVW